MWAFNYKHLVLAGVVTLSGLGTASITIGDPSDTYQSTLVNIAADNALLSAFNFAPASYLLTALKATTKVTENAQFNHQFFQANANDTDVILTDKADLVLSYSQVLKLGYSSNLYQASFYGVNAAVNIQNDSVATLDHVNITTHNGAANVYAYGTGTMVTIEDSILYSSGPVAHGLYAAGNSTIVARNVQHYSGGYRSSSFAGDVPKGDLNITNCVSHTTGIGSATFYVSGTIHASNVAGYCEKAPAVFMDGNYAIHISESDLTGNNLAGMIIFSSGSRQSEGVVTINNSVIRATGSATATLWFGNVISTVEVRSTSLLATSGNLVVANTSQVTQDFSYFASPADISDILPAEPAISVFSSQLTGDLVSYNGSTITWKLSEWSSWTGTTKVKEGSGFFNVALDKTSTWYLTADTTISNFTNADATMSNVISNGFQLNYDSKAVGSKGLGGKTFKLPGGGNCKPY